MTKDIKFSVLGTDLKRLRQAKGLSQAELGRAVGLTRSSICKFENADETALSVELLEDLARAFGLPPAEFVLSCVRQRYPDLDPQVFDRLKSLADLITEVEKGRD